MLQNANSTEGERPVYGGLMAVRGPRCGPRPAMSHYASVPRQEEFSSVILWQLPLVTLPGLHSLY